MNNDLNIIKKATPVEWHSPPPDRLPPVPRGLLGLLQPQGTQRGLHREVAYRGHLVDQDGRVYTESEIRAALPRTYTAQYDGKWHAGFKIGNQSFVLHAHEGTQEEAQWYAKMMNKAFGYQ